MNKPISISLARNKLKGKSIRILKNELLIEQAYSCKECHKVIPFHMAQLDHIQPVRIGGSVCDKKNLQLLCMRCHRKKTISEIMIINTIKRLGFIRDNTFFLSPDKVIEIFKILLENKKSSDELYERHDMGEVKSEVSNFNRK